MEGACRLPVAGPPARNAAGMGKALCEALPFHGPIRCRRKGKGLVRSTFLSPAAPLAARVFAERLAGAQAFTCQWGAHGARPAKRLRAQPKAKPMPRLWPPGHGASGPPLAKHETASGPPLAKRETSSDQATGKPMLRTWPGAEQFCSARPVRAPPEGQCPAYGQVLRKKARGHRHGK